MKKQLFCLKRITKDYYGVGNNATEYFMGYHRYEQFLRWTSDKCSLMPLDKEGAELMKAHLSKDIEGKTEYFVEAIPDDLQVNIRGIFG